MPLSYELLGGGVRQTVNWTSSVNSVFPAVPNMFNMFGPCTLQQLVSCTAVRLAHLCLHPLFTGSDHPGHERRDKHSKGKSVSLLEVFLWSSSAHLYLFSSCHQCHNTSGCLLVWVALQFVEFNAVQLLEPLLAELAGVVVVGLRSVFLHVPVEGGALATLVATDFTSDR